MENRGGECRERGGKSRILRNLVYDCGRVPGAWRQAMLCVRSVTGTSTSMNVRTHFTSHHGGFFRRHSAIGGVFNSRQASDVPFRHLQQSAELDRHDEKGLREKNRQSSETEHDGKVHARKTQRGLLIHIHCLLLNLTLQAGCEVPREFFEASCCSQEVGGGFVPGQGVRRSGLAACDPVPVS